MKYGGTHTVEPLDRVLECALLAAHLLLESGAETYRAEESAERICLRFGADAPQIMALPTGAFATIGRAGEPPVSGLRRVKKRATDLRRIDEINRISRAVSQGDMPLEDALSRLTALARPTPRGRLSALAGFGASAGSSALFAVLFGGGWFDFLIAGLCGLIVQAISSALRREDSLPFILSLLGGAVIAAIATAATALSGLGDTTMIIAGALMPLLPGLAMTNAIRDTIRGDLVSGVARAAEALLAAVSLAVGVGVVLGARIVVGGWPV